MSVVEAAGYAMAPSEEDMADHILSYDELEDLVFQQPEAALRNGHSAAARRTTQRHRSFDHLTALVETARRHWSRDLVAGWWGGRATA